MAEATREDALHLGDDLIEALWSPRFPTAELVSEAAALVPSIREESGRDAVLTEGPRWRLTVGPGMVSVRTKDYAKSERTHERQVTQHAKDIEQAVAAWQVTREWPQQPEPTREITGWSAKSRARMVERLCQLDYTALFPAGRLPAMVTLTYPGDWETVAPQGSAVKKHLKAFRKRWKRAWGEDLACVWKLEFQRRGAPHFHLLCSPPHGQTEDGETFRMWLSRAWAEVVAHPDPDEYARHVLAGTGIDWNEGLRSTDPKRVAVYFTKHGAFQAKEYQHHVPQAWRKPGKGPGGFWGCWVLKPATETIELSPEDAVVISRLLRRWAKAQGVTRQVTRPRVDTKTGRIHYRSTRVRVKRMAGGRGFVSVNDGAAFVSQLARYLNARAQPDLPLTRHEAAISTQRPGQG